MKWGSRRWQLGHLGGEGRGGEGRHSAVLHKVNSMSGLVYVTIVL